MVLANRGTLEQTRSCLQELKGLVTPKSDGSPSPSNRLNPRSPSGGRTWWKKLTWPLDQDRAEELLRELESHKTSINLLLATRNVFDFRELHTEVNSLASKQGRREILVWLKPGKIDSHEIHLEKRSMREEETCDWMTRSDIWKTWVEGGSKSQDGHRRLLWIHGIPGAGKTILASFLIDAIANNCQSKGYSYYYCSYQRGQDETRPFLQWVLADLCNQCDPFIPQELLNLYEKHRGSVRNVLIDDLLKCLIAVTRWFPHQVCIAVDAVDESSRPRNHFLKVLTTIGTDPDFDHVSLVLISRDEQDIRAAVEALPPLGKITSFLETGIDMIDSLELSDEPAIQDLLQNLPDTVFDTYERLIVERIPHADGRNEHNRTFARTALALICSNSSEIPSADVLVEASLFNVPRGLAHAFDIKRLERILGCLIKVTKLNRRPASVFTRDDDANNRVRVAPAHYTVKEYLFAPNTAKGPAKDFALTNLKTQILELEVVFNGLLQFGNNRPRGQNQPTRYEEYCLRMTEKALESRRALIVREQSIWEAVFPCLKPNSLHLDALRNVAIRQAFPKWAKLNALFRTEKGAVLPSRQETSILVSLLTLNWPELAAVYLKQIAPDDRAALWADTFIMSPEAGGRNAAANPARDRTTILRLCVARRRIDFLEHFLEAGADFAHESRVLFDALREPYAPVDVDAGGTTGQLLKMVLQRGADPNPPGCLYTPLQEAVRHLEERWVQSLLLEHADPNAVGDPKGEHPYGLEEEEDWYDHHPLEICRSTRPPWQDKPDKKHDFDIEDQVEHARLRVEALLFQFGATEPEPEPESESETEPEPADDSHPDRVVIMID
ncbi:hypothetical protein DL771_000854 [Monosporascus sp. 5C6A]|nr:hypothetical protein DL771_000854 [Monosporascus sp. 5C6A]